MSAYGALRARPGSSASRANGTAGLVADGLDPEGEALGPPLRRPAAPPAAAGTASRAALVAAFSAPFVALLLVGAALSHQSPRAPPEQYQIENIGVLGVLIPSVAGGGSALRRNLELLYEQRVALHNPGAVEVFIHHPHEDESHNPFHEIHAEKVEWGRRVNTNHPGFFFSSAANVVSNPELEGVGDYASRTLRFKGWRFSKDTNAALSFVDRGGRAEVLQLEGIRQSKPGRIHQVIKTMRGVKYTVRYDVLLPPHLIDAPAASLQAPCGLHFDGTHGRAGNHYSIATNGSAWCDWRTGMLLLASGGVGDLGQQLEKAKDNALLQLFPHRESEDGWLSLEGTFTATDKLSTVLFHVEPGETALFDKVSVHSTSYHHDEHHLVPSQEAPLSLHQGISNGAYCESIDGTKHLSELTTQVDCDAARGIWIRTPGHDGDGLPTELSKAQRQHTYDTVLLLRWFAHVVSLRVLKSHTFYGANQLPYFVIIDDDYTFCPKALQRLVDMLRPGGPLDGTARQWGAIRIAHGLNGLVMREEHVLKMIEFIEAPKRQLAHPVGDLLQRFAESLPGSVWNLRLNLIDALEPVLAVDGGDGTDGGSYAEPLDCYDPLTAESGLHDGFDVDNCGDSLVSPCSGTATRIPVPDGWPK